jgi:Family of unknown function (DUF5675)
MELVIQRDDATGRRTFGKVSIDGVYQAESLERATLEKRPGYEHPAIPAGRYRVVIDRSERFSILRSHTEGHPVDVLLPHVLDVPGRIGIRFHPFNDAETESQGCTAFGTSRSGDRLVLSRPPCERVQAKIAAALNAGDDVFVEVRDPVTT